MRGAVVQGNHTAVATSSVLHDCAWTNLGDRSHRVELWSKVLTQAHNTSSAKAVQVASLPPRHMLARSFHSKERPRGLDFTMLPEQSV